MGSGSPLLRKWQRLTTSNSTKSGGLAVEIWTDGSSAAKGDLPGGWGYIIILDGHPVATDYGGDPSTTNNRMELTAAIKGLEAARPYVTGQTEVTLYSDSQYTLGLASGKYSPQKNKDLAQQVRSLTVELGARCEWVRGHAGIGWNEMADRLAKKGKEEATK